MNRKPCPNVGGQAVIEGVMMRSPWRIAISVRRPNGEIITSVKDQIPLVKKHKLLGLPIIRGVVNLVDSLVIGFRALSYSATMALEEENEKMSGTDMTLAMLLAFGLFVGLFIVLPAFLTGLVGNRIQSLVLFNLLEGLIRIGIFILYLLFMSLLKDIRRVFEYHGAEHKTIYSFENGDEVTLDSVRNYQTAHPRCGTNWLIVVMVISIFIFSLLGRPGLIMRVVSRIIVIPLVAGLAYEVIKLLARHQNNAFAYVLALPGLLLQKITTKEPDEKQLEVAMTALRESVQGKCDHVES
ncbi:MAG TPA: DUF1385 domain-containing protein [Atribacteraceae bacterium]|nr:DUF1385 domain-containing protein [Atribacteraceae bacterium]